MKATGIVRKIDDLGRFVIPMELRKLMGFDKNQPLEVFVDGTGIIIKKYERSCVFCANDIGLVNFGDKIICTDCVTSIGGLGTRMVSA